MKHRRVPHSPDETVLGQVVGHCLLPVQCRIPGAIQAQAQPPEHFWVCVRVRRRDLDVQRPRALGVEVRAGNIIDHDLSLRPADFDSRCSAEDNPESFEWRMLAYRASSGPVRNSLPTNLHRMRGLWQSPFFTSIHLVPMIVPRVSCCSDLGTHSYTPLSLKNFISTTRPSQTRAGPSHAPDTSLLAISTPCWA